MKCNIILYFIRVYTVCYGKTTFTEGSEIHNALEDSTCNHILNTMDNPILIVSIYSGKSTRIQRVNGIHGLLALKFVHEGDIRFTNSFHLDSDEMPRHVKYCFGLQCSKVFCQLTLN